MSDALNELSERLAEFARVRDWEQFHSPKNLSMALIAEAAELVEHFRVRELGVLGQVPESQDLAVLVADLQIVLVPAHLRLDKVLPDCPDP